MNNTEFVITEKTENYGWCLFCLASSDKEKSEKYLKELQQKYPDKELRVESVPKGKCWWRLNTD